VQAQRPNVPSAENPDIHSIAETLFSAPPSSPRQKSIHDRLFATSAQDRPVLLRGYLARTINAVLGHEPGRAIKANQPLTDLGMDSLASIQLGERLTQDLRASLPVRALLHGTIESLASALCERLASPAG
jgi:acyl carrier protein